MTRRFRHAALHFALVAMFLRALMPVGWMPDAHAGFTICSATLGLIHHDGGPDGHDDGSHHQDSHEECPFAAAAPLAAAPDLPAITLPSLHAVQAAVDTVRAAVIAARFTPQSLRGPPLNA